MREQTGRRWGSATALLVAVALVALLLPLSPLPIAVVGASSCSHTWAGTDAELSGEQFRAPESWLEGTTPDDAATVCIGAGAVRLVGASVTVATVTVADGASLTIAASTLTLTAPGELGGIIVERSGELAVAADTVVASGSDLTLAGGVLRLVGGATVRVDGTVRLGSGADVTDGGERPRPPADAVASTPRLAVAEGGRVVVDTEGADPAQLTAAAFEHRGILDVQRGGVELHAATLVGAGSVTGAGKVTVTGGAEVLVTEGADWSPAVSHVIGGSVLRLRGERRLAGVSLGDGELDLRGGTVSVQHLGSAAAATSRITGDVTLRIPEGATLDRSSGGPLELGGTVHLVVDGTMLLGTTLTIADAAQVLNRGWLLLRGGADIDAQASSLRNEGAIVVDAPGDGARLGGQPVDSPGTLRVNSGTLHLGAPPLQFRNGTWSEGTLAVADGAALVGLPTVDLIEGEIRLEGQFALPAADGSGGALDELHTVAASGVLQVADGARLDLTAGRPTTLTNEGRIEADASSTLVTDQFVQQASGTLAVEVGAPVVGSSDGPPTGSVSADRASLGGSLEVSTDVAAEALAGASVTVVDAPRTTGTVRLARTSSLDNLSVSSTAGPAKVTFAAAAPITTALFDPFSPFDPGFGMSPMVNPSDIREVEGSAGGLVDRVAQVEIWNPGFTSVFITWAGSGSTAVLSDSGAPEYDAEVPAGSAMLPPGTSTVSVPYRVVADQLDEIDEFFSIDFYAGQLYSFGAAMVTIVDDDEASLRLTPTVPSTAAEGTDVIVSVTLSAPADSTISVPVAVDSSTATIGSADTDDLDVSMVPSSLVVFAGMTSASFTVRVRDDDVPESGESFRIEFGTPSSGTMSASSFLVQLGDGDPPAMRFSAAATTAVPTESGSTAVVFDVVPVVAGGSGTVRLPVTLVDGTAWRASDFHVRASSSLSAPVLRSSDFVNVPAAGGRVTLYVFPVSDGVYEGPETFELRVGRSSVLGEQATTIVTIPDAERLPTVSVLTSATVAETVGLVSSTLRLSGPAQAAYSFDVAVGSGDAPSATPAADFVAATVRVTITGGTTSSTFTWRVLDDQVYEAGPERVRLSIVPVDNPVAPATATVGIVDDDAPPVTAVVTPSRVTEGQSADIAVEIIPQTTERPTSMRIPVRLDLGSVGAAELSIRQVFAGGGLGAVIPASGGMLEVPGSGGTMTVRVSAVNDGSFELPETVRLVVGRSLVPLEEGRGDIVVDDAEPRPNVTVRLVDDLADGIPEAQGTIRLEVRTDRSVPVDLPFRVQTRSGTAEVGGNDGSDVGAVSQVVTVKAGATSSQQFTVPIVDDTEWMERAAEDFLVVAELDSFPDAVLTLNVLNDDLPRLVQFDRGDGAEGPEDPLPVHTVRVTETSSGDLTVVLPVIRRYEPADGPLTVTAELRHDTTDPSDAGLLSSSVTLEEGQSRGTVTLVVSGDVEQESAETLFVTLNTPDSVRAGAGHDTVQVLITDDDGVLVTPAVGGTDVVEGGELLVSAELNQAFTDDIRIPVTITGGTATVAAVDGEGGADIDTTGVPGELLVEAGATSGWFRLLTDDDDEIEPDETFTVTMGAPSSGRMAPGVPTSFTIVITDDDVPPSVVPMRLELAPVTMTEGAPIEMTLVATPIGRAGTGPVRLPVRLGGSELGRAGVRLIDVSSGVDVTAGGELVVPATGGTVRLRVVVDDDRAFTPARTPAVVVGRADVPGEEVQAIVTIVDDEPVPTVRLESESPYLESAGAVPLHLQLSGTFTVPVTYRVVSVGFVTDEFDYEHFEHEFTIPAGSSLSSSHLFTILDNDDGVELDREDVVFEITAPGLPTAIGRVTIVDNEPVLPRFVRGLFDPADKLLTRQVTETDTGTITVVLPVRLTGPRHTEAVPVDVTAFSLSADEGVDYIVEPTSLVFQPGEVEKNVVVTVLNDDVEEPVAYHTVMIGIVRPDLPGGNEAEDMAHVTIVDDDEPVLLRFVRGLFDPADKLLTRRVTETDTGTVTVVLPVRLTGPRPTEAVTVEVVANSDRADEGVDYTVEPTALVFQPGEVEKNIVVTVLSDDLPEDDEKIAIAIAHPNFYRLWQKKTLVDVAEVTIVNDDERLRARFSRSLFENPDTTLRRDVRPGSVDTESTRFFVELTGDPITEPYRVNLAVNLLTPAVEGDFVVEVLPSSGTGDRLDSGKVWDGGPLSFVVHPGDQPRQIVVTTTTARPGITRPGVALELHTDAGAEIGRVDDVAAVYSAEPAPPSAAEQLFRDLVRAWNDFVEAVMRWLRQFDLGPSSPQPPVAQPLLHEYFQLDSDENGPQLPRLTEPVTLPSLPDLDDAVAEVCRLLGEAGVQVRASATGACGGPATTGDDLLRVHYEVDLRDLATAAGVDLDAIGADSAAVLAGLASSVGLRTTGSWDGDLSLVLDAGIDPEGAYVLPSTELTLAVSGEVDLSGTAQVAGATTSLTGSAAADFSVRLTPGAGDPHDLARGLAVSVTGSSTIDLALQAGPLSLEWGQRWRAADGANEPEDATLGGGFEPPQLLRNGVPARVELSGRRSGDIWRLDAEVTPTTRFTLGGFDVRSMSFGADIGPATLTGRGALQLDVPLSGTTGAVDVAITAGRTSVAFSGSVDLPDLDVGVPTLVRLIDPTASVELSAALPAASLTGSVGLTAASAVLLPASPVATAVGVSGTISSTGRVQLAADSATMTIASGAVTVSTAGARIDAGPGAGAVLLAADELAGTVSALPGVELTVYDLTVSSQGKVGARRVEVDSPGFAESVNLGGLLPFDITEIAATFPDPTDLDQFRVDVTGRFDFSGLDTSGGITPRLGLGAGVVTPSTPPANNRFTFSLDIASLAAGEVRPYDVGPIVVGFDGLRVGEMVVGGEVSLGGYDAGRFVPSLSGAATIDGPAGSALDQLDIALTGTITDGSPTVVDMSGTATVSGTLGDLRVDRLQVSADLSIRIGRDGLTIAPRITRLSARSIDIELGSLVTLQAADVTLDPTAPAGGHLLVIGSPGGTVRFAEGADVLAGWGGRFANVAIGSDFTPRLLPGFAIDLSLPPGLDVGLPEWLPFRISSAGITFPAPGPIGPDGLAVGPDLLAGMRVRVSGGIEVTEQWPIGASVEGLEIDLEALVDGEFPITNLSGLTMGVDPFELPGDVTIGGQLQFGVVDVGGTEVLYGRIRGEFSVAGIGGGADLVVTQYGPVLMGITAPLGIPLGPTGLVLASVDGRAHFGGDPVTVPPRGDPVALINTVTLATEITIDAASIARAVEPVVRTGRPIWTQGFTLSLGGKIVAPMFPGLIDGQATMTLNLGLPEGPNDPVGVQLVGVGELRTFGMALGRAGVLIDLADPTAPSYNLAYSSPVPGSPLALIMPARTTFGVQIETDGVVLGTIAGMRAFVLGLLDGVSGMAEEFFAVVLDQLVARLAADPSQPLAALLLDLDGNGRVEGAETSRIITRAWLMDRLVGRNGVPGLLPAQVDPSSIRRAGDVATTLMNQLVLVGSDVIGNPQRFGVFDFEPGAGGTAFADLVGAGGRAMAALAEVIRSATAAGLAAFGDLFDPSLTITGALQPTFLGLPLGDPTVGGSLAVDRHGLTLSFQGNLTELAKKGLANSVPVAGGAVEGVLTATTFGLSNTVNIEARLPVGGLVDTLVGGGNLPTFQPLDPNWAVTLGGNLAVFGFEAAEVTGMAFMPGQRRFLEARVQKLYELPPGTPIDPDLIPVSSPERFEALVQYGGLLVTSGLRIPRLLIDPAEQLEQVPPPPTDPLRIPAWLEQVGNVATASDTPARMQVFLPGLTGVTDQSSALAWANNAYVEGVLEGRLLGMDIGRLHMETSVRGLEVTGRIPLLDAEGTVVLNTGVLDSGVRLPSAGLDVALSTDRLNALLEDLGVPSTFTAAAGASGRFRLYTPGVDPASTDPLLRRGGMVVSSRLDVPGLVSGAAYDLEVVPSGSGFDVHGRAAVGRIGPIAGVTIDDASIELDITDGVPSVRIDGTTSVLGAAATVDGVLNGDLTGSLSVRTTSGTMNLAGAAVSGTSTLTTTWRNGMLEGALAVAGTATLPPWLGAAAGRSTLSVVGCVDSAGSIEVALSVPALALGPSGLVTIGRAPGTATLPPSTARCTLPADAPAQSATGPMLRLRSVRGVPSAVLSGSINFSGDGAVAGLSVSGSLDGAAGTGSLAVSFAGGSMAVGGFSITGSATARFGSNSFTMEVNGSLDIGRVLSRATVSGVADERGISSLSISASSVNLDPLRVASPTLSLVRTGRSYALSVGATVSFDGIGSVRVNGNLDSAGLGALSISTRELTIGGASLTGGTFVFHRTSGRTELSATGNVSLFGTSLEVPEARLALTTSGGRQGISGSLVVRPKGGGSLRLGGWAIGGTLRMSFTNLSARLGIDDGSLTIPGWGAVDIDADIAMPVTDGASFTLQLPSTGLRLGGSVSPFYATGSFGLSFTGNVAALKALNPTLSWRSGTTTLATFTAPSVTVRSDGFLSVAVQGFSSSLGGFGLTVPSASLLLDAGGLNARLALGSGSIAVPGLPTFTTPAFTIGTSPNFSMPLVSDEIDLGIVSFAGDVVFERTDGVFRLLMRGATSGAQPEVTIDGLFTAPVPSLAIASNGTFSVSLDVDSFGPPTFRVTDASLQLAKTGPRLADFGGSLTGGMLRVGSSDPISLPSLSFDASSRIDRTFDLPAWDVGPALRVSSSQLRIRQLSSGVMEMSVLGSPSVTVLGNSGVTLNSLVANTLGTFTGSVTGQLTVFGSRLASASFDITRVDGVARLTLPASRAAEVDLGFLTAKVSGFASSDGTFSFNGNVSVSRSFLMFNVSGSLAVRLSSSEGIAGAFTGSACFTPACGSTSATLRSDGRLRGTLTVDVDGRSPAEIDLDWRVYLASGALLIDINRDNDWNDIGDVYLGDPTDPDTTPPSMTQPPDVNVAADIPAQGSVPVYFDNPTATDGGTKLAVVCTPGSGSQFSVGVTTVTCAARDSGGNTRTRSFKVTVTSTASSSSVGPPMVVSGTDLVVDAAGLLAASQAGLFLRSDPIFLGMFPVDEQGRLQAVVTLPPDVPEGRHHLVILGLAENGSPLQVMQPVEVVNGPPAPPPMPTLPPGTVPSSTPPPSSVQMSGPLTGVVAGPVPTATTVSPTAPPSPSATDAPDETEPVVAAAGPTTTTATPVTVAAASDPASDWITLAVVAGLVLIGLLGAATLLARRAQRRRDERDPSAAAGP